MIIGRIQRQSRLLIAILLFFVPLAANEPFPDNNRTHIIRSALRLYPTDYLYILEDDSSWKSAKRFDQPINKKIELRVEEDLAKGGKLRRYVFYDPASREEFPAKQVENARFVTLKAVAGSALIFQDRSLALVKKESLEKYVQSSGQQFVLFRGELFPVEANLDYLRADPDLKQAILSEALSQISQKIEKKQEDALVLSGGSSWSVREGEAQQGETIVPYFGDRLSFLNLDTGSLLSVVPLEGLRRGFPVLLFAHSPETPQPGFAPLKESLLFLSDQTSWQAKPEAWRKLRPGEVMIAAVSALDTPFPFVLLSALEIPNGVMSWVDATFFETWSKPREYRAYIDKPENLVVEVRDNPWGFAVDLRDREIFRQWGKEDLVHISLYGNSYVPNLQERISYPAGDFFQFTRFVTYLLNVDKMISNPEASMIRVFRCTDDGANRCHSSVFQR